MRKNILLSLLFLLFLLPQTAFAQKNQPVTKILRVAPAINDIHVYPGHTTTYTMDIDNLLPEPLGIRISIENFSSSDEDNGIMTNTSSADSPLINWIKTSDQSLIMPEQGSKTITVTVTPPKTAAQGGYYGIIFFTPFYISHPAPNAPVILSKVGTLLFGTIGNLNYKNLMNKVYILNFSIPWINEKNQIPLTLRVQNSYFTHFSGKPFITITPLFGSPQTIELEDKHILPGTTRRWIENITVKEPWHVFYSAHLAFSVGAGNELFADTNFFIFPVTITGILIGIIVIFLFMVLIRKRLKKAIRILIHAPRH